jgi:hypothetical protein
MCYMHIKQRLISYFFLLLVMSTLPACALRVSTDETEVVTRIKSLSQVLKESEVATCTWIQGHAPLYLEVTIVLAGRVPMETCLDARQP